MAELIEKYVAAFHVRKPRERLIIVLSVLVVMYLAWDLTLFNSLNARRSTLDLRYESISREMNQLTVEEKILSQALANNPNTRKLREIKQLDDRLK